MQYRSPHIKKLGADLTVAEGSREFVATISTVDVDREKEVLIPDGVNTKDFEKSPTVFWNHDYSVPIGKATGFQRNRKTVVAKAEVASRPDDHPEAAEWFPDTVLSLIKQGVIRGVSVGFESLANRRANAKDKELYGPAVEFVHSQWKLLEFSVAPLPANQNALITAVSKGLVTKSMAHKLFPTMDLDVEIEPEVPLGRPMVIVLSEPARRQISSRQVAEIVDKRLAWHLARRKGRTFY